MLLNCYCALSIRRGSSVGSRCVCDIKASVRVFMGKKADWMKHHTLLPLYLQLKEVMSRLGEWFYFQFKAER